MCITEWNWALFTYFILSQWTAIWNARCPWSLLVVSIIKLQIHIYEWLWLYAWKLKVSLSYAIFLYIISCVEQKPIPSLEAFESMVTSVYASYLMFVMTTKKMIIIICICVRVISDCTYTYSGVVLFVVIFYYFFYKRASVTFKLLLFLFVCF